MRILFVGDIVGRPGRRVLTEQIDHVVVEQRIDLVVANCENSASGFGVTPEIADSLFEKSIHVLTSGNHVWDKRAILNYFSTQPRLLRPANYPGDAPGSGVYVGCSDGGIRYAVLNLQGRTYLPAIDCPFRTADRLLREIDPDVKVRLVDFHAEVTSEKIAFGWYLDGRVSAVVGTHTHVPTADERILPAGTAYITDVGMTGPHDSVIGMEKEASISRFLTGLPARFEPARGDVRLNSVVIEIEDATGRAVSIERCRVRQIQGQE
jgi:metallophosphoesterase (TIGR00282 family)